MKKTFLLFVTAVCLIIPLFLIQQKAFAGDPNCQSGHIDNPYNPPLYPTPPPHIWSDAAKREEKRFAAAQVRSERNQMPPGNGFGQEASRFDFAGLAAAAVMLGGLWLLFVLLGQGRGELFGGRRVLRNRVIRLADFALKPSFAFSIFGLLILGTIIGSQIAAPVANVSAQKREKPDKQKMTGVQNPSNKPVFKTAQVVGGDELTQIGAPVFDAMGNRYLRGTFTRNLTIGSTTLHASAYFDLFFAKYDTNGNPVWARQATGATTEIAAIFTIEGATALAVDANGNVYVGGSFVKKLTLQGGANPSVTLNDNGAPGVNYESFVAKYDTNGNLLWAQGGNSGSPKHSADLEVGQNAVDQIVIGSDGSPYVTGFVSGTNFLGSPIVGNGKTDILLAKLDAASGAVIWRRVVGGEEDDNGLDLKIDNSNNLYLSGNFASAEITFPTSPATNFRNPQNFGGEEKDSTNAFVAKFDSGGDALWAENLNNAGTVGGSQIAVNPAGEIFLTGYYFDSVTFQTVPETTLTEGEGSGEDEDALGGYVTKLDTDGNFLWARGFGGVGEAIALDQTGRVHVAGTFWDGGTFGAGTPNVDTLASFGGEDLFVARYDSNGGFDWAKPIAASGQEGLTAIASPDQIANTENSYNPFGIAYNPARGTMFISSDFQGVVALDCLTLQTPDGLSRHSYIAELSGDTETTSCRIWNGLDEDDNNFDSPDNWNGGIVPNDNDNVYVPYTGNSFDNPNYNPAGIGVILENLTVADDRTLTLNRDLVLTGKLWLLGGFVDAGAERLLDLTDTATANRIADADGDGGYVIGKIRKEFGDQNPFIFPVGTSNGYSPVDVAPQAGSGALLAVKAFEQPQPMFANAANRINRYWNLNKAGKGFLAANLTFHYLQGDVVGDESRLRLFKIEDGEAMQQMATINMIANTATVNDVSEFSDWTLAQSAPTAATTTTGGRVTTATNRGIAQARLTLTNSDGSTRTVLTNALGFYRFAEVETGATYVFSVSHKRFGFAAPTLIQTVTDERNDINFIAQP